MERTKWLQQMRREAEEKYDEVWAPLYREKWGRYSNATHQHFLATFLGLVPPESAVLDAACGAGRYMGRRIRQWESTS